MNVIINVTKTQATRINKELEISLKPLPSFKLIRILLNCSLGRKSMPLVNKSLLITALRTEPIPNSTRTGIPIMVVSITVLERSPSKVPIVI